MAKWRKRVGSERMAALLPVVVAVARLLIRPIQHQEAKSN